MPAPVVVKINSKTYNIPILSWDMEIITQEIESYENEIIRNRERMNNAKRELANKSNCLLLKYIQHTGEYPPE